MSRRRLVTKPNRGIKPILEFSATSWETAHMARFLIEVPHESEVVSCARANKVLLESGSHFLTHADFGCLDGVHKAWIVVEMDSKDEARNILPPVYRHQATIVQLSKFGLKNWTISSSFTRAGEREPCCYALRVFIGNA
jgi:hypothetical protein